MNPSKAWAMLNARGAAFGGVGGGGIPSLTASDIARMLTGLERGPFLAGMVKECGDIRSVAELERWLWIEAMNIACRERWPFCRGQAYCRRMAGLAVYEFIVPVPSVCESCSGDGFIVVDGNGMECTECRNRGGRKMSANLRSELAGIPYTSWRQGWGTRYEAVYLTVQGWHSAAMSHMRRAFENLPSVA